MLQIKSWLNLVFFMTTGAAIGVVSFQAGWNLRPISDNTIKPVIEAAQSVQAIKENPIGFLFPAKDDEGK